MTPKNMLCKIAFFFYVKSSTESCNISWRSFRHGETMPLHEEERTPPPSPWRWPPAGREQSPRRLQIWHNCIDKRNIPKGRRREQEEACHKKGAVRASRLHDAPGAGEGVKRIRAREPAHLRPVLRAAALHPGVDVAAGVEARRVSPSSRAADGSTRSTARRRPRRTWTAARPTWARRCA